MIEKWDKQSCNLIPTKASVDPRSTGTIKAFQSCRGSLCLKTLYTFMSHVIHHWMPHDLGRTFYLESRQSPGQDEGWGQSSYSTPGSYEYKGFITDEIGDIDGTLQHSLQINSNNSACWVVLNTPN